MLTMERVFLTTSDDDADDDDEDELYKGYNEFHPALDTRNLQEDEVFKETVNKSSYGRVSVSKHRTNTSTAGVAFNRATALKSRRTAASRGTGGGGGTQTARPLTAVRGAGYTSQGDSNSRFFDPLGLANSTAGAVSSTGFHLQNENQPEWKMKQLELQINRLLEESVNASDRKDWGQALDLAKDCVAKERSLNRMKEQSGLMETYGPNSDLTFAVIFNLAEQYSNSKMWPEALNTYQSILKNRSFTNTGRLRMNIGEIYFRQGNYPKAIKFFRMALDQIPNTQNELRLKLMQNIGLSFVRLTQFADAIASFEYIMSERGDLDAQTAFHLIVCYYALGDSDKMKYYFNKLLQVKVEDQFEERYGHHEILTNGGNIFASPSSPTHDIVFADSNRAITPATGAGDIASGRVSSPVLLIRDEHDHHNNLLVEAIRNDRLRQYEKEKIAHVEWCVLTAAKLIAPYIDANLSNGQQSVDIVVESESTDAYRNMSTGYEWCLEQIRRMASMCSITSAYSSSSGLNFVHLADELELYKAVKHLRARDFDKAIGTLKMFERKDKAVSARSSSGIGSVSGTSSANTVGLRPSVTTPTFGPPRGVTSTRVSATAATNLSFLYLLQQDLDSANRYADEAIAANRYCLGALLNKASIYYHQEEYRRAIDLYQEVVANNSTSFEAHYNMALAERKLANYEKALELLFRLQSIHKTTSNTAKTPSKHNLLHQKISNTIEINLLYQIGSIYEAMGNTDQAIDYYQKILNLIPTDVSLLVKLGDLASDNNDRKQSLSFLMEAYRYLPSHIPTIERLAAYYIEMKMYEKAIKYLEQLANIQPQQIKWQLMIAASYRRAGNYQQAFTTYQDIHSRFPDNVDCLRFLIRLCAELESEGGGGGRRSSYGKGKSYQQLGEQYAETLKRLEKSRELREHQQLQQQQSSSRSASRASTAGGGTVLNQHRSASSREGSAATTSSGGSGSSGYMTSATHHSGTKTAQSKSTFGGSSSPLLDRIQSANKTPNETVTTNGTSSILKTSTISAIVDQVVEQLDNTTLNERPTTSWRRRLKSSGGNSSSVESGTNGMTTTASQQNDFDDDLLLDANIDDILPD